MTKPIGPIVVGNYSDVRSKAMLRALKLGHVFMKRGRGPRGGIPGRRGDECLKCGRSFSIPRPSKPVAQGRALTEGCDAKLDIGIVTGTWQAWPTTQMESPYLREWSPAHFVASWGEVLCGAELQEGAMPIEEPFPTWITHCPDCEKM